VRDELEQSFEDCQSSKAGIENTDGRSARCHERRLVHHNED
jgi:hypothetical protein